MPSVANTPRRLEGEQRLVKQWSFGDKVVHLDRPEWGVGTVNSATNDTVEGRACQRLTVRFERAGVKNLNTGFANLVPASDAPKLLVEEVEAGVGLFDDDRFSGASPHGGALGRGARSAAGDGGGGAGGNGGGMGGGGFGAGLGRPHTVARDVMTRLPDACTDPFSTPASRLAATINLYRYTEHGASLLDWAAAQSGLRDPLTRFSRHELEDLYRRFMVVRDDHMKKVSGEARRADAAEFSRLAKAAPRAAQQVLRRFDTLR
ncbi:MAG: hypothetical protein C0475_07315 [Planctomyces sp.]|nr:hypothetical protein [Planctomyces sp.]